MIALDRQALVLHAVLLIFAVTGDNFLAQQWEHNMLLLFKKLNSIQISGCHGNK